MDKTFARAKPEELWPDHLPRDFNKKVAMYGGGYTRRLIHDHPLVDDDCEVWSANHVWNKEGWGADCPRIDRLIEIHDVELLERYPGDGDRKHWRWLQEEHPFPIYMLEPDERFPSAVPYPLDEIKAEFFGRQYRGAKPKAIFGSSIDFLTGLALYEGADWIGYFGIEMGSSTEHLYQVPGGYHWTGIAAGRDVTTWVPDDPRVQLLRQQIYSIEGFQMISRQTLELHLREYERQCNEWREAANSWLGGYRHMAGQIAEHQSNGNKITPELAQEATEVGAKLRRAREAAAIAKGCVLAINNLIEHVDLHDPDLEIREGLFEDITLEEVRP
jgi:enamine deaminase RidA (YjgF/YER057c/UK114 family)